MISSEKYSSVAGRSSFTGAFLGASRTFGIAGLPDGGWEALDLTRVLKGERASRGPAHEPRARQS